MIVDLAAARDELLSALEAFNADVAGGPPPPHLVEMIQSLVPMTPIASPAHHMEVVAGSWTSLFAKFGQGYSKGKSHRESSTLAHQSFKAFGDTPIRLVEILQEIEIEPRTYNNVILFETLAGVAGTLIIEGDYTLDTEDPHRFHVTFFGAEIRPGPGVSEAELKADMGLDADAALKRSFKPARFHSDIVYLDETLRVNYGGMGGVYVLTRRSAPPVSIPSA